MGLDYFFKLQKSSLEQRKEIFHRNFTSEEIKSPILFTILELGKENVGESVVVKEN